MTSDPTDVSHAPELVIGVDIKDVFDSEGCAKKVPSRGVDDTLWFAGGSGRLTAETIGGLDMKQNKTHIENEQRVLRRHNLRWAVIRHL